MPYSHTRASHIGAAQLENNMSSYDNIYHRDGTTTIWDVYQQQWTRREDADILADSSIMSTLNHAERARIEARANGMTMQQAQSLARYIIRCADDGGVIQADEMIDIAGMDHPELHTTMTMMGAAEALGCGYVLQSIVES